MFGLFFSNCTLVRVKKIHSKKFKTVAGDFSGLQGGLASKLCPASHSVTGISLHLWLGGPGGRSQRADGAVPVRWSRALPGITAGSLTC